MKFKKIAIPEEIVKAIDAAIEEEKKVHEMSTEVSTASTIFVSSIVKTADKFGESRETLLQTAVMGVLQSLFDVDWSTFDPDTGMFKEMK